MSVQEQLNVIKEALHIDERVLKLAFEKARRNGWDGGEYLLSAMEQGIQFDLGILAKELYGFGEFARALWGDEWEKHLFGLALVENPIRYLERFL